MKFTIIRYKWLRLQLAMVRFRRDLVFLCMLPFWLFTTRVHAADSKASEWIMSLLEEAEIIVFAIVSLVGLIGAGYAAWMILMWGVKQARGGQSEGELKKAGIGIILGAFWMIYGLIRGSFTLGNDAGSGEDYFGEY